MPRDANGNYTLPTPQNPVESGTLVTADWANTTLQDIAQEITNSLDRTGQGGFTAPLLIVDKEGTIPGLAFAAEPISGIKREAAGDIRYQVLGQDKLRILATPPNSNFPINTGTQVYWNGAWRDLVFETNNDSRVMMGEGSPAASTTIWMQNATTPLGWWTQVEEAQTRMLMIGPTTGADGGSDDPVDFSAQINITISGTTGATAVSHTHRVQGNTAPNAEFTAEGPATDFEQPADNHKHGVDIESAVPTGGPTATEHSHTFSGQGSDTLTYQPRYLGGILAKIFIPSA